MSAPPPEGAAPEIIAHRGYSAVAPENTLAAIRAAVGAGASSVEVDVRTAFDGTPVLFHDVHLGRTSSGVGPVRRRTVGQLKSLDAGAWFSDDFEGEPIPTLSEALEAMREGVERAYLEVKGYREMEDLDRMVEIARAAGLVSRCIFIALDWTVLDRIGEADPTVGLGYIVEEAEQLDDALDAADGDARALVDLKAELALDDPELVASARERGVDVAVWTVDEVDDARTLLDAGVRRFTTNQVERLLDWSRTLA